MDFQRILQQVQAQRNQFADAHAVAAARADTLAVEVEKLKADNAGLNEMLGVANEKIADLDATLSRFIDPEESGCVVCDDECYSDEPVLQ